MIINLHLYHFLIIQFNIRQIMEDIIKSTIQLMQLSLWEILLLERQQLLEDWLNVPQ